MGIYVLYTQFNLYQVFPHSCLSRCTRDGSFFILVSLVPWTANGQKQLLRVPTIDSKAIV